MLTVLLIFFKKLLFLYGLQLQYFLSLCFVSPPGLVYYVLFLQTQVGPRQLVSLAHLSNFLHDLFLSWSLTFSSFQLAVRNKLKIVENRNIILILYNDFIFYFFKIWNNTLQYQLLICFHFYIGIKFIDIFNTNYHCQI